ncbi:hypothetical protein BP5796_12184 [Coleophoma crateriformis]|uniref:Carrier domain-containing protein n=1 Tax=Coleophoma crateriformis TaxID=565419 RepID=A0A3D8QC89_9HELO|nr:hypothetical protein BP5796_12184 [Coleophoma crateriformis]
MHGTGIPDLPPSKLPSFHATTSATARAAAVKPHTFTVHAAPICSCSEPRGRVLLHRFARFVGDVVESNHVAYLADTSDIGRALVQAVIPSRAEPKFDYFARLDGVTVEELVDFHICIGLHNTGGSISTDSQKIPFVLYVEYIQEDKADISLSLRSDYGGLIATKHLATLAAAYLNSDSTGYLSAGAGLKPSRVNFEPFLQATSEVPQASGTNAHAIPRLLHTAFEENVRQRPDNVAIEYLCRKPSSTSGRGGKPAYYLRDLTYEALNGQANNLASELGRLLQALENRWTPVMGDQYAFPLFIPPSPELFLTMLAVVKSGHAFSSLPADAPAERLRGIVDDLGAPIVLGIGAVPWQGLNGSQHDLEEILWIDVTNPASWRTDSTLLDSPLIGVRVPGEDDICYLFYTSGSTGKPKGVLGSHRAAVACVESTLAAPLSHLPTGPRLRWLNLSAPSFDPVIIDTFVPLSMGGVLCVAERDLLLTDMEACACELRATASYAVASLALLMRPEKMPGLKTLIVGGESVNDRVIEKFARAQGSTEEEDDRHLINAYGPTETTIFMTAESCTQNTRSSIIGDALCKAFCLVADAVSLDAGELRELPFGLAGELIVGGPQVALGYLNRPEATARAFIPVDRFPALGLPSGMMLYRTGDKSRVVWSDEGNPRIDFLGRIDTDQVKLNGRRVELTEIENVLTGAHGVAAVAVVVVKPGEEKQNEESGGRGDLRTELVAFVTAWPGEDGHTVVAKCRAEVERLLPTWMCPGTYIVLDQLPWTASGKVDRKTLVRLAKVKSIGDEDTALSVRDQNGKSGTSDTAGNKDVKPMPMDSSSIITRGLVAALGNHAAGSGAASPLWSLGLDSLRAIVLLQSLRDDEVEGVSMHGVLSSRTVGDLINLVESRRLMTAQDTAVNEVAVADVDVAAISIDDEGALYDLPIATKLRHFSHHCLSQCSAILNLAPAAIERVLPATNTQIRILYIATQPNFLEPSRYSGRPQIEHFLYDVPLDKLNPIRLRQAVDVVLRRHDCFRTVFCSVEHPLFPFAMCILNKDAERAEIPTVEVVCKFDQENTSLWQSTLVSAQLAAEASMSPDRPGVTVSWVRSPDSAHHVMILSLSHPIYDGVMLGHLREEIAAEYASPGSKPSGICGLTENSTNLPLLPMHATVELLLRGTDWTETMFYWMKRFSGVPTFRFGPSRPVPQAEAPLTQTAHIETTHMRRSALYSSLSMQELSEGAASCLGTTMAAAVQVAWASVLAQTHKGVLSNGQLDIQFGSILHGRTTQDLWRCVAPLLTTVPMHLVVDQNPKKRQTNREVCLLLATQNAEVAPYIDVPCPSLPMFEMGHSRFDTVLNLQAYKSDNTAASANGIGNNTFRDLPGWNHTQNLLPPYKEIDVGTTIMMELWPAFGPQGPDWSGKMTLKATYNARRPGYEFLSEQWVAGILGAMEDALVRILEQPDKEFYVG